jgi:uroporphyrinogen-III decarboxylase
LKPVDRIPNAPFQEAPICRYFGRTFRSALLEDQDMADCHFQSIDAFQFDWVMVGMGLIGGIIPDAMGCTVKWPEDVFPIIEKTTFSLLRMWIGWPDLISTPNEWSGF